MSLGSAAVSSESCCSRMRRATLAWWSSASVMPAPTPPSPPRCCVGSWEWDFYAVENVAEGVGNGPHVFVRVPRAPWAVFLATLGRARHQERYSIGGESQLVLF